MAAFPKLKTGAVAQYPAARSLAYATDVHRFLDGTEQKYRVRGAPARRWGIRLELLDDTELAAIEEFFVAQQGRYGSFSFEDPWDSTLYSDCSFEQDEVAIELTGERRGRLRLVIRSNEG
jgi:hypothetical protein